MVPADTRQVADIPVAGIHLAAVHIPVAGIHLAAHIPAAAAHILAAAAHILAVDCYKDPSVEVVMGERSHHTDLADLGLDPD